MNFLRSICFFTVMYLTYACDDCEPICASQKSDPSYQRTFKNKRDLKRYNRECENKNQSMTNIRF